MPTPDILIKICGLSTPETLDTAIACGADMAGFVFFAPSPRNLTIVQARDLAAHAGARIAKVALTVDADDAYLDAIVSTLRPDLLQLHGKETPERVVAVRRHFGIPVMKAIGVAVATDLAAAQAYAAAERILYDAKAPRDAVLPGGNGRSFDWAILSGENLTRLPWMLSGGLDADNVGEAIRQTGAPGVDVSSGVESAPGVKDPERIAAFIAAARAARSSSLGGAYRSA
jgi:phosphoribosylanthranilate isomerase